MRERIKENKGENRKKKVKGKDGRNTEREKEKVEVGSHGIINGNWS